MSPITRGPLSWFSSPATKLVAVAMISAAISVALRLRTGQRVSSGG